MSEFFWQTAAIRFSTDPGYEDPRVEPLLEDPIALLLQ
jgi:hypothetical protein